MERVGPAPDTEMFMDANGGNVQPVTVEYDHALVRPADGRSASRAAANDQPSSESAMEDYRAELGVGDGN